MHGNIIMILAPIHTLQGDRQFTLYNRPDHRLVNAVGKVVRLCYLILSQNHLLVNQWLGSTLHNMWRAPLLSRKLHGLEFWHLAYICMYMYLVASRWGGRAQLTNQIAVRSSSTFSRRKKPGGQVEVSKKSCETKKKIGRKTVIKNGFCHHQAVLSLHSIPCMERVFFSILSRAHSTCKHQTAQADGHTSHQTPINITSINHQAEKSVASKQDGFTINHQQWTFIMSIQASTL